MCFLNNTYTLSCDDRSKTDRELMLSLFLLIFMRRSQKSSTSVDFKTHGGPRQLRASEFVPGNQDHINILRKMGITLLVLNDGKVQLVQQQNAAASTKDATVRSPFCFRFSFGCV